MVAVETDSGCRTRFAFLSSACPPPLVGEFLPILVDEFRTHKPQEVYTFSFILGNIIPKSVKSIHSSTKRLFHLAFASRLYRLLVSRNTKVLCLCRLQLGLRCVIHGCHQSLGRWRRCCGWLNINRLGIPRNPRGSGTVKRSVLLQGLGALGLLLRSRVDV